MATLHIFSIEIEMFFRKLGCLDSADQIPVFIPVSFLVTIRSKISDRDPYRDTGAASFAIRLIDMFTTSAKTDTGKCGIQGLVFFVIGISKQGDCFFPGQITAIVFRCGIEAKTFSLFAHTQVP